MFWPGSPLKGQLGLCLAQEFRSNIRGPFWGIPFGLENQPNTRGEDCPTWATVPLARSLLLAQGGKGQGKWEEERMPAGRGHCLQTERDSFEPGPGNGTDQLVQEVGLLQAGSPELLSWPPSEDHKQPLGHQGTARNAELRLLCREVLQSLEEQMSVSCPCASWHLTPQGRTYEFLPLTVSLQGCGAESEESTDETRTQMFLPAPHLHRPLRSAPLIIIIH